MIRTLNNRELLKVSDKNSSKTILFVERIKTKYRIVGKYQNNFLVTRNLRAKKPPVKRAPKTTTKSKQKPAGPKIKKPSVKKEKGKSKNKPLKETPKSKGKKQDPKKDPIKKNSAKKNSKNEDASKKDSVKKESSKKGAPRVSGKP